MVNYIKDIIFSMKSVTVIVLLLSTLLQISCQIPTNAPTINSQLGINCTVFKDITILLDRSGSICDSDPGFVFGRDTTCSNWATMITFIGNLVRSLDIGPLQDQVSVVLFDDQATILWPLNAYWDKSVLLSQIANIRYVAGLNTYTTSALRLTRTQVFNTTADRPNFPNLVVIITDGKPTIEAVNLPSEAVSMHNANIQVIALGITDQIDAATLKILSSYPQQENATYFLSPDFNSISWFQNTILSTIYCPPSTVAPSTTTVAPSTSTIAPLTSQQNQITSSPISPFTQGTPSLCNPTPFIADIVFVLDQSGSICDSDPNYQYLTDTTCSNWKQVTQFVQSIVQNMNIGSQYSRVGMITFQTFSTVRWYLSSYLDKTTLLNMINTLPYNGGQTNTTGALWTMRTQVFNITDARTNVPKIAIFITDGQPNIQIDTLNAEIQNLRNSDIKVYSVGISGAINEAQIQSISSPPQLKYNNYFTTPSFQTMSSISIPLQISIGICFSNNQITPVINKDIPVINPLCPKNIVFIVDGSGSICDSDPTYVYGYHQTCNNWKFVLSFIYNITNSLTISTTQYQVGMVTFDSNARLNWNLNSYLNKVDLLDRINALTYYPGGNTATTDAMQLARTQIFGVPSTRQNVQNLAVLITDGYPTVNVQGLPQEVQNYLAANIKTIAVGVTSDINLAMLQMISSAPKTLNINYFTSPSFAALNSILGSLQNSLIDCSNVSIDIPGTSTPKTGPQGNINCSKDIVFVIDRSGSICDTDPNFVYGRDSTCSNWASIVQFVKRYVSQLAIGPNDNQVAVVMFDSNAYVMWLLTSFPDKATLLQQIENLTYQPGRNTDTTDGILAMRTQVFNSPGDRPNFKNTAIIITDGLPTVNVADFPNQINLAQQSGIKMFAVGITNQIDVNTLKSISSQPKTLNINYFTSPDYVTVDAIRGTLQYAVNSDCSIT